MFRAVKTNGFNLEPTNLQNFDSISKLISVVVLPLFGSINLAYT